MFNSSGKGKIKRAIWLHVPPILLLPSAAAFALLLVKMLAAEGKSMNL
jgi:hypothetical protein